MAIMLDSEIFSPKLGTFSSICYFEIVELSIIGKLGKTKKILLCRNTRGIASNKIFFNDA